MATFPSLRAPSRRRGLRAWAVVTCTVAGLLVAGSASAVAGQQDDVGIMAILETQSLDGRGNNRGNPAWGQANTQYTRVAGTRYADGRSRMVPGPNSRMVSNRTHNDINQNLFSENGVTQWGAVWGQFLDHTFGLRAVPGIQSPDPSEFNIPFNRADPLEAFTNDLGSIAFSRSDAAPGTGVTNPRQQINTVSSYIDAWVVYSGNDARLEWLREGPVDGNMSNNSARLLLPGQYLPRRDTRGNPGTAPIMDIDGRLRANPNSAVVAGDVRANENISLTATHLLFAREHNRIVSRLPSYLSENDKFQIARRFVIAQQQYITYNEFLPAMGVQLPSYRGYDSRVNANLTNEFATVGYRAHSQIHGEVEVEVAAGRYTAAQLAAMQAQGIEIEVEGADIVLVIPLNVAFFNPELVKLIGAGPLLRGIGLEAQYRNDEQIDNQLRSVLFQIPVAGNPSCLDGPTLPQCFRGVTDLGAIDIERGRDHGMPTYNQLRAAYGLPAKTSFTSITGESTDQFPRDPLLTPGNEVNDPNSLDFVRLLDIDGNVLVPGSPEADAEAVTGIRRTTLASRLRAVYGSVNNIDAFVGMVAERHVSGSEFGELQLAIWRKQFAALRDGDRFFYANDSVTGISFLRSQFPFLDHRRTLAQVIAANTDIPAGDLNRNVFLTAEAQAGATAAEPGDSPGPGAFALFDPNSTPARAAPAAVATRRRRR